MRLGDLRPSQLLALGPLFLLLAVASCSDTTVPGDEPFQPTEAFSRRDLSGCSVETPTGCVTVNDGAPAETRYTLLNVATPEESENGLHLVDGLGRFVNYWPTNGADGEPLPEPGNILAAFEPPGPPSFARLIDFRSPCIAIMGWQGETLWPNTAPPGATCPDGIEPLHYATTADGTPGALGHHDLHVWGAPVYWTPTITSTQGDGRVLFLSHSNLTAEQAARIGPNTNVGEEPVVEIAADGRTVLWEWIAADHYDEFGFDNDTREAIAAASGNLSLGGLPTPPGQGWLLLNAASYLGPNRHCPDPSAESCDHRFHPDNVLVNSRQGALMWIVARHAHPNGNWPSGAVVWQIGPNFDGAPYGPISGQHHPHMIPTGLPGEGNILVFDNGSRAGFGRDPAGELTSALYERGYSRVLEIDPVTDELVWSYEQPEAGPDGTPVFNAFNLSSSQRLENGNTFIDEGNTGRLFEVSPNGEIVWEFQSPFPLLVDLNFSFGRLSVGVYRAHRVPPQWVTEAEG